MTWGFTATIAPLLILSGLMQWRLSKCFDGSEYARERIMTGYSGIICFALAFLCIIIKLFI